MTSTDMLLQDCCNITKNMAPTRQLTFQQTGVLHDGPQALKLLVVHVVVKLIVAHLVGAGSHGELRSLLLGGKLLQDVISGATSLCGERDDGLDAACTALTELLCKHVSTHLISRASLNCVEFSVTLHFFSCPNSHLQPRYQHRCRSLPSTAGDHWNHELHASQAASCQMKLSLTSTPSQS